MVDRAGVSRQPGAPGTRGRERRSGGVRLDAADRAILTFAAEHRLVLERQVERLLASDQGELDERLTALTEERYLRDQWTFGAPHYRIQRSGLVAIESPLPVPGARSSPATYKHDIGLAWLWLAAHGGTFGPLREVLSERTLRSRDGVFGRPAQNFGVRTGGIDRYGNQGMHYPDLLLIDSNGRTHALELELSRKRPSRLELILGAYGADPRVDRILYLVEDHREGRGIGRRIEDTARDLGLSGLVGLERIKPLRIGGGVSDSLGAVSRQASRAGRARDTPARAGVEAAR